MSKFPSVPRNGSVDANDWTSAVDFVNRVNWLFETYDLEGMISSFLPDARVYHFHGNLNGEGDIRRFLTDDYPYLIPGVSRNATNHVVDRDADGVAVRYQNVLVRHAWPQQAVGLQAGQVLESDDLPAIWLYSPMLDRLRLTDDGWKIAERHIGGSMMNKRLSLPDTSRASVEEFLPGPGLPL
ncbi:nuclear transport factor 2 family protein [Streptomyces sp. NPDC005791]|uniref:nuclear transport factor 2 family protein n=1 Tax=unclassified Streptomyces TaxID=2593676 RepID=UPI0033DC2204